MTSEPTDLPEAAERRMASGAFSSGLSVADFAACLEMGLEPVGFAQGFCAMQWSPLGSTMSTAMSPSRSSSGGGYNETFTCPHGFVSNDHRQWGQNYEQTWYESAWRTGFDAALQRMVEEATEAGAHGVVGVVDSQHVMGDGYLLEFHLSGTAVKVPGAPALQQAPFTTYLAGQRLAKVIEAGFAPVGVIATLSSVRMWPYCITEYQMHGTGLSMYGSGVSSSEVDQVVTAKTRSRQIAREAARRSLHGDSLHGARVTISEREYGQGEIDYHTVIRGNRIRRFQDFVALPGPQPTVRLS